MRFPIDITSPRVILPGVIYTLAPNAPSFVIVYYAITRINGYSLTKADYIVPLLLYLLIKPNIKDEVASTITFLVIFALTRKLFPQYY